MLESPQPPNVLLIVSDDQPFRTMSAMPYTLAALSPGVELTRAYSSTPQCGPSRATILSGRYVHNIRDGGLTNDHTARRYKEAGWPRADLAYNLSNLAGYRVGLFGKWLNDYEKEMPSYVPPGYSKWKCSFRVKNQIRANVDGRLRKPDTSQSREVGWLVSGALEFMAESKKKATPFFTILSVNSPHAPYTPTQASRDLYAGVPLWNGSPPPSFDHADPNKPGWIERDTRTALTSAQKTSITSEWRGKMAEIRDVDNAFAPLFGSASGAVDFADTYVFFLTDNGYLLGEHRLRQKNMPYEESSRTPFFVRGPGLMESATTDVLAANVDVAPTIYELAGLPELADACDGRSLLGALVGAEPGTFEWRDSLLLERYPDVGIPGWRGVRSKDALYVEWDTGDVELYDMDPASASYDPYQKASLQNEASRLEQRHWLSERIGRLRDAGGDELRANEGPVAEVV